MDKGKNSTLFVITGDALDPKLVTAELKCSPFQSWAKGEEKLLPKNKEPKLR